jgi:hypothetical protein
LKKNFRPLVFSLFADQNKDTCCQRDKVEEEDGRPKIHAKPQQAINDQINREQNHADASIRFHAFSLLDCGPADNPNFAHRNIPLTFDSPVLSAACHAIASRDGG